MINVECEVLIFGIKNVC